MPIYLLKGLYSVTVLMVEGVVHACLVTQWCPTLCEPLNCSPPGSSVHRIFQARILKCKTLPGKNKELVSSPGNRLNPRVKSASPVSPSLQVASSPAEPLGKPQWWGWFPQKQIITGDCLEWKHVEESRSLFLDSAISKDDSFFEEK